MTVTGEPDRAGSPGFAHLDDEVVHRGHVWHVSVARFRSPDGEEFTRDEMVECFQLAGVNRAPASFDPQKLMAF